MEYSKSEITKFAKECASASNKAVSVLCMAEEISHSKLVASLKEDNELLLETAKRFAKYTQVENYIDFDNGEIQDFCTIINAIIECCEENSWFRE